METNTQTCHFCGKPVDGGLSWYNIDGDFYHVACLQPNVDLRADLAEARNRITQLEEENRQLREENSILFS